MTKTEIRKALYKEKPKAFFNGATMERDPIHEYQCWLEDKTLITFMVPRSDMGENKFQDIEQAQLLIRWIKLVNNQPI